MGNPWRCCGPARAAGLPGLQCLLALLILTTCAADPLVVLRDIEWQPKYPRTEQEVFLRLPGRIADTAPVPVALATLAVDAEVSYCRRTQDCMQVLNYQEPLCSLLNGTQAAIPCPILAPGESFELNGSWVLPRSIIRGAYHLQVHIRDAEGHTLASTEARTVNVLANSILDEFVDFRDAAIAFAIAASASKALGVHFPSLSNGNVPQISGFLCIGVLVGPYCANLVSRVHVFMLGTYINRFSLAFIGGAAGAEIFLPDFLPLLGPLAVQVACALSLTLCFCTTGLLLLVTTNALWIPAIATQPTMSARVAVSLLAGVLMTTSAPGTTIAVITELKCGHTTPAKMALGITVMQDVIVLILFSITCQFVRFATEGDEFSATTVVQTMAGMGFSIALGGIVGWAMRWVLPKDNRAGPHGSVKELAEVTNPQEELVEQGSEVYEETHLDHPGLRGLAVLLVLSCAWMAAESIAVLTNEMIHGEPLIVCITASCITGHDESRRAPLLKALAFWCPHILLPFFTLAGASLNVNAMFQVFPAAIVLVALRSLGLACGGSLAGLASSFVFPSMPLTRGSACMIWSTVMAQAGLTMGLVIQIANAPDFAAWSKYFSPWVLGVVVINQLMGPVASRMGLSRIIKAEQEAQAKGKAAESSEGSSSDEHTDERGTWRQQGKDSEEDIKWNEEGYSGVVNNNRLTDSSNLGR